MAKVQNISCFITAYVYVDRIDVARSILDLGWKEGTEAII